jgi:hypothetical protein
MEENTRLLQISSKGANPPKLMTPPTTFSYTVPMNQVLVLNLGPTSAGAFVGTTLNSYTTISGTTLTIAPTLSTHIGSSVIKVTTHNIFFGTIYSFTITVLSTILYFSPSLAD